ncbi:MAG: serine hydrolase [Chloroflexota bacterium]
MIRAIQRFLITLILIAVVLFLLFEAFFYYRSLDKYPTGMTIADVPVAGMVRDEAATALIEAYTAPIAIRHREERVAVDPRELGFTLDVEQMLAEAETAKTPDDFLTGYAEYVLGRALEPITISLVATHDEVITRQQLGTVVSFLDQPAVAPQLLVESETLQEGRNGFVTDIEASLPIVTAALYATGAEREAQLVVIEEEAPERSLELLRTVLQNLLDSFDGFASIFVMDLETGDEIGINADVAVSGLSILKIPIFVEAYAVLDQAPDPTVESWFYETAVNSSNFAANQLLHVAAGENNTYRGADVFTEGMRNLGLLNTFIAVPYDAPEVAHRPNTYVTPANSRTDVNALPDISRQTTAEEIGTLLSWLYYCAEGTGGALLAAMPDKITPAECQAIIDVLLLNVEGNLIRFGVPEEVPVSHKHGWNFTDHGDAGLVYSPNRDYVIYMYLSQPGSDWLEPNYSFPIMREISRAVYNYFNYDAPYTLAELDARTLKWEQEHEAAAAAAAAAAAEEAAEPSE